MGCASSKGAARVTVAPPPPGVVDALPEVLVGKIAAYVSTRSELLALRAASRRFLSAVEHAAESHQRKLFESHGGCVLYPDRFLRPGATGSRNPQNELEDAVSYALTRLEAIALPVEPVEGGRRRRRRSSGGSRESSGAA